MATSSSVPLIGLSSASVYPESTAHAFGWAAQLGYDAVEVMVGIDSLSQQVDAVKKLSDHHQVPICAVHAPCLLFTQRVWGTDPWVKLERSAEMADAVGADVVVVHPPFRWQKDYAAGFVEGIASLEARTGIAFAVENMYPWRASSRRGMEMYLPGWDPSSESYANTTIDLSHAAIARSDVIEMADRMGDSLRHIHLTDGTGSAKDEHLVPGRGVMKAEAFLRHLAGRGFSGHVVLEINTRRAASRTEREADLQGVAGVRPRAPRRAHAMSTPATSPATPRTSRGRRPGAPDTRAEVLAAARASFAEKGFRGTTIRAVAASAGVDPALVHHYFGSKDDLFLAALEMPVDPRELLAPVVAQGPDGAGERLLRTFLSAWDDPEIQVRLLAVVRSVLSEDGATLLNEGFIPVVVGPVLAQLVVDRPEVRVPLVASQVVGLIVTRYLLALPPMAEMSADDVVARVGPVLQHYLTGDLP